MQDDNWWKGLTNDLLRHHQCNHPMFCFYLFHAHRFPSIPLISHGAIFSRKDHQNVQSIVASNRWDGEIQKESKKAEFSQVFRLPGFCRDPTNTFAKLPINSGHLFMRPSPQIQMLDLAGFVIFPCLWNICILWNVECIMNWTVAHVYNSFKASLKCTHMCAISA